jgi:antitoxin component YwqK of YwqJK toxin-antitoxin module
MKKEIISILSISLMMFAFSATLQAQNKTDDQGKKQGLWIKKDKSGNRVYQGTFKDDYPVDTFYYYKKGKVETINVFTDKGQKCKSQFLYENGKVKAEGMYEKKNKEGMWSYYNEQGKKISEESYKNNVKDGLEKKWDNEGKEVIEATNYKNGKKQGEHFESMYGDGYFTCTYKNDKLEGKYGEFFNSKNKKVEGQFINDKKEGEWKIYTPSGEMIQKLYYKNDSLQSDLWLFKVREGIREVSQSKIALMYPTGKQMQVILSNGEKFASFTDFELLLNYIDENLFIRLNEKQNIYANIQALKGINKDSSVEFTIPIDFKVIADENGSKAIESLFKK